MFSKNSYITSKVGVRLRGGGTVPEVPALSTSAVRGGAREEYFP